MLWLRQLFFLDSYQIARTAAKRPLEVADLKETSLGLRQTFEPGSLGTGSDRAGMRKFLRIIMKRHYYALAKTIFLFQVTVVIGLYNGVIIKKLLESLTNPRYQESLVWAAVFVLMAFVNVLAFSHYILTFTRAKLRMTYGLRLEIMRKAQHLDWASRQKIESGDLINFIEVDTNGVSNLVERTADGLGVISHIVIAGYLLWSFLGVAGLLSIAALVAVIPLVQFLATRSRRLDAIIMVRRDTRTTFMSQILSAIRLIKFFAWDKSIEKDCGILRRKEIEAMRQRASVDAISSLVFSASAAASALIGFGIYVWLGGKLDTANVFAALVIYINLPFPFLVLKDVITTSVKTFVSAKRLVSFFSLPETPSAVRDIEIPSVSLDALSAECISVELNGRKILKDISFKLNAGESLAIIGPVGSGKTILLESLLGEVPISGKWNFAGREGCDTSVPRISYIGQNAFILNSTIHANVSFGANHITRHSVESSLRDAAFTNDLLEMPGGIETEIGENGINLSGGQKQRISLARAMPPAEATGAVGRVIYLALEEKESQVRQHFLALGVTGDEDILIHTSSAPLKDTLDQLYELIGQHKPALVVVDTLFRLVRVKDANDYASITNALEPLGQMARTTNTHILCVHHMSKQDREGADGVLGSTAITGSVDAIIMIRRTQRFRTIRSQQRYGIDLEESILVFDSETRTSTLGDTVGDVSEVDVEVSLNAFLRNRPGVTEATIKAGVPCKNEVRIRKLRELCQSGLVVRSGRGGKGDPFTYSLPVTSFDVPAPAAGQGNKNPSDDNTGFHVPCSPHSNGDKNIVGTSVRTSVAKSLLNGEVPK